MAYPIGGAINAAERYYQCLMYVRLRTSILYIRRPIA